MGRKKYKSNWYQRNKKRIRKQARENYYKNRSQILEKAKEYYRKNREKILKQKKEYNKRHRQEQKLEVLIHYGGNPPRCSCCSESHFEFLCIDHIHGRGKKHREKIKWNFYHWLIKNNFPRGFQVLCYNCDKAKAIYGVCPHAKEKKK